MEKPLLEISDIAGLSKPLTRLVEVVAQGIGAVTKPMLVRRNADARAYEIRAVAAAVSQARRIVGEIDYVDGAVAIGGATPPDEAHVTNLLEDVSRRVEFLEAKRQSNLEEIVYEASENLKDCWEVADEKPDPEWISRFFRIAEDVSSKDLQNLWSRVLSGEIENPGSYALRTLDVLRNISLKEAELFSHLAAFAIHDGSGEFVFVLQSKKAKEYLQGTHKIRLNEIIQLREIGLLVESELSLTITMEEKRTTAFVCGLTSVLVTFPEQKDPEFFPFSFPVLMFTRIGIELLNLIKYAEADDEYITEFARTFQKPGVLVRRGLTAGPGKGVTASINVRDFAGNIPLDSAK